MAEFTPVSKASSNIKEDLRLAASDRKLTANDVDFDLLSYETYYKRIEDTEWHPMNGDNVLEQITEEEMLSSEFLLQQQYQICIRPFVPHQYLDLRFSVAMSKATGKVTAVIDPTSVIPLKKGVQEWIKEVINRKKLRLGFMIGTADKELDKEIIRLLATIQKKGPLTDPYHLPIAKYFPPVDVINDAVILHYKKLNENNSYIQGVQPGDLLIEYVFPKPGRNGRGLDGAPIIIPEPTAQYAGVIQIDETTIVSEKDANSIRYYALVSGFVKCEKGIFLVAQELHLESVSMKTTGSIEAGTDKEISLTVEQQIFSEDAVGIGVHIDVQKVDISGTVGENTRIQAEELNIGAQTHRKSTIDVSQVANIHLHRGDLKAKEANIDVLEGGRIEADIVRVNKMLGGEIIARKVYVDVLYSHASIIALESIEINHIEGEGNALIIDPYSVRVYHEKISELVAKIQDKESLLKEHKETLSASQLLFKEKNTRIKQFQQRIVNAKKSGYEPMKADLIRIQHYKSEAHALHLSASKLREEEEYLDTLHAMVNQFYEADLHAVVTHHGTYNGNNRVAFIDPKTRQEYGIFPEGKIPHIRLDQSGEEKVLLLNAQED
ncbi:MAG: FapA family protein [Sulfuricurvum sp.]|nr:FapA family protein [Sulfuricurvum sp.]